MHLKSNAKSIYNQGIKATFGMWKMNYKQLKEHLEAEIHSRKREINSFKLHRNLWDGTLKLFETIWQNN